MDLISIGFERFFISPSKCTIGKSDLIFIFFVLIISTFLFKWVLPLITSIRKRGIFQRIHHVHWHVFLEFRKHPRHCLLWDWIPDGFCVRIVTAQLICVFVFKNRHMNGQILPAGKPRATERRERSPARLVSPKLPPLFSVSQTLPSTPWLTDHLWRVHFSERGKICTASWPQKCILMACGNAAFKFCCGRNEIYLWRRLT